MSSIEHPQHQISDEIFSSLRRTSEAEEAAHAREDRIDSLSRPNEEERRVVAAIQHEAQQNGGLTPSLAERLREVNSRKFTRVREELEREAQVVIPFDRSAWDRTPVQPAAADPTFWWARTDWSFSPRSGAAPEEGSHPDFSADLRADGLHFFGGVTTHDGDLHRAQFGAVALFELQADRIPRSPTGRWISTPHVELFGALRGYTGDDDIFTGDLWSKCWMHRDQQLFQLGFGQNGPVPIVVGQAHEFETLVFEENNERAVHVGLRGFQWMPPVTFGNVNLANSLWSRIEVRFDIQTEGAGTLLWLDPEVLLRTFQWPLTPL